MEFSKETRRLAIERMQDRQLDLLIIGGGITGAGVALQAAASGMETALIEMQDFAEGTSSRSTKWSTVVFATSNNLTWKWYPIPYLNVL